MIPRPTLLLLTSLAISAIASLAQADAGEQRPVVVASIPPQAWMIDAITDDLVAVEVLLPVNASHVNYALRPSQITALSRAHVFIRSGLPFEERMWDQLRALNDDMQIVGPPEPTHHSHDHHDHAHDPHFWVDPMLMALHCDQITETLIELYPESRAVLTRNGSQLRQRLELLDDDLRRLFSPHRGETFWCVHGSWGLFAEHYGLVQRAIEFEGKENGVASLARVIDDIRATDTQVILAEPGLDPRRLSVLQTDAGVRLESINLFEGDYETTMREAALRIVEALK